MFDSGEKKSERNNQFSNENFSEGSFSFFFATNLELFLGGIDHVPSEGGHRSPRRLSIAVDPTGIQFLDESAHRGSVRACWMKTVYG